jgi:methylphosphotriester-DNA--protein-cysteine methyltransferase
VSAQAHRFALTDVNVVVPCKTPGDGRAPRTESVRFSTIGADWAVEAAFRACRRCDGRENASLTR